MQRQLSFPHLFVAVGLVLLAGGLGLVSGNSLGGAYTLIAAILVATRSVDPAPKPALVVVKVEP